MQINSSQRMANPYFKFKKFTVWHDRCSMKVGTDGVLLGAWADVEKASHILDVGTGTGLIALMLAQRNPLASIVAIDLDQSASLQAAANVAESPFKEQIQVEHISLQNFAEKYPSRRYDLIVSNPPYFANSLLSPDKGRSLARHADALPLEVFLENSVALMNPLGRLAVVLPYEMAEKMAKSVLKYGLYIAARTDVITVSGAMPKRSLLSLILGRDDGQTHYNQLTIELSRHQYTDEFKEMTADFYLKH